MGVFQSEWVIFVPSCVWVFSPCFVYLCVGWEVSYEDILNYCLHFRESRNFTLLLTAFQKQAGCCALILLIKQTGCEHILTVAFSVVVPPLRLHLGEAVPFVCSRMLTWSQLTLHICFWTATSKTCMFRGILCLWSATLGCYSPHPAETVGIPWDLKPRVKSPGSHLLFYFHWNAPQTCAKQQVSS